MKFHTRPDFKSPKSVKTGGGGVVMVGGVWFLLLLLFVVFSLVVVFFLNLFQIQNMRLSPKLDRLSIEQQEGEKAIFRRSSLFLLVLTSVVLSM